MSLIDDILTPYQLVLQPTARVKGNQKTLKDLLAMHQNKTLV